MTDRIQFRGTTVPTEIPTQKLLDQRAHMLDEIYDIIRTAKENGHREGRWPAAEKERHDEAVAKLEALDDIIRSFGGATSTEINRSGGGARYHVPNVNTRGSYSAGDGVTRSLDAMLWATPETVVTETGARNPVEQIIVRSDVADTGQVAPRLTEFSPDHRDAIRSFQATVADMALFGLMIDKDAKNSRHGFEVARSHRLFADRWQTICRALDVDTSGEGGTWVPTGIGGNLHEMVRALGKVAPLFTRVNLPQNPWKWPVEGSDVVAYRVAEPTSDTATKVTASTPGSIAPTFDAEILGARTLFSRSLDADSALAIVPFTKLKLAKAFSIAEERAILDGDSDGTHMDSDVGSSTTDARTLWDGLRKHALAETSIATTTSSVANLAAIRKAMGVWGVDPGDLAFIIGVSSFHVLQTDTNLLTVDKMGPNATLLNGQIGSIYGVPVIVSQYIREDLNASGVYDGITTTKSAMLCVHRREWVIGDRMQLDVEIDDSIYRETYQRVAVAFSRSDFQTLASASTDDNVSIGYNLTSGS